MKDFYTRLVYARKLPVVGKLSYYLLKLLGSEIPVSVPIGPDFLLEHGGHGVVTLGRADIYLPITHSKFEGIEIEDDVILSPGCKVLCKEGVLRVGKGSVIGANAVLLQSTGEYEIWAGSPARCIGERPRMDQNSV